MFIGCQARCEHVTRILSFQSHHPHGSHFTSEETRLRGVRCLTQGHIAQGEVRIGFQVLLQVNDYAQGHMHRSFCRAGERPCGATLPTAGANPGSWPPCGLQSLGGECRAELPSTHCLVGLTRGPPVSGCCPEKRHLGFGFRFSPASRLSYCVALENVSSPL